MSFWIDDLTFDDECVSIELESLASEVDDGRRLGLERCSATSLPVHRSIYDGLNSDAIALRSRASDLGCINVHERQRASVAVDLLLHEISVEEEKENRRQRRALRQACLWKGPRIC